MMGLGTTHARLALSGLGFVVHAADVLIQADAGAAGQNGDAKAGPGQSGMSGTHSHHCLPPP